MGLSRTRRSLPKEREFRAALDGSMTLQMATASLVFSNCPKQEQLLRSWLASTVSARPLATRFAMRNSFQQVWQAVILPLTIDEEADSHEATDGTASGTAPLSRYSESVNLPRPQSSLREGSSVRSGSILVSAAGRWTIHNSSGCS